MNDSKNSRTQNYLPSITKNTGNESGQNYVSFLSPQSSNPPVSLWDSLTKKTGRNSLDYSSSSSPYSSSSVSSGASTPEKNRSNMDYHNQPQTYSSSLEKNSSINNRLPSYSNKTSLVQQQYSPQKIGGKSSSEPSSPIINGPNFRNYKPLLNSADNNNTNQDPFFSPQPIQKQPQQMPSSSTSNSKTPVGGSDIEQIFKDINQRGNSFSARLSQKNQIAPEKGRNSFLFSPKSMLSLTATPQQSPTLKILESKRQHFQKPEETNLGGNNNQKTNYFSFLAPRLAGNSNAKAQKLDAMAAEQKHGDIADRFKNIMGFATNIEALMFSVGLSGKISDYIRTKVKAQGGSNEAQVEHTPGMEGMPIPKPKKKKKKSKTEGDGSNPENNGEPPAETAVPYDEELIFTWFKGIKNSFPAVPKYYQKFVEKIAEKCQEAKKDPNEQLALMKNVKAFFKELKFTLREKEKLPHKKSKKKDQML